MTDTIRGDDEIARCIIFPKAFQGAVHTDEVLFVFTQSGADGASHESGVLCRLAPSDADIHSVGCGIAAFQNGRANIEPESEKRRYYCGFRKALARHVEMIGDKFRITLNLDGEGGQAAHVDIALIVDSDSRSERTAIKVEAGMTLAEAFGSPVPHICDVDADNPRHPLHADSGCLTRGLPQLTSIQTSLAFGDR